MRCGLPSGRVTFLFTDVEGSTKLLHELGAERYAAALAEHRRALRNAFEQHGGVEVDTQGDAFFYVFPTAKGALAGAEQGKALASGRLRVRMGLHTGTPHLGDEGYVGSDVHLGARIAACGHGGQVLVSKATRELVGDALMDLGEHRLKDFADPVWIFQVGTERFPPLRTISNTNLPRPVSAFVGRDSEKADVRGMLLDGSRLVTLFGPGGAGKTRLAIEVAAELVPDFKNGVYWVGLAALRDPALVSESIAQTLGAKDGLDAHIAERELLLLLDNFEQVVEAAPELSSLLSACPNLRLLVTSRELLRLQGEREYAVPPLVEKDAVALFCERSGLAPDATIGELCARLDELPLALELAAARARVLSPDQILARLSQRLDLLKGGRDADPRQQTLRAAIEWSYDLLDPEERPLFAGLSVFRGGCPLDAAEEVCGADLDTLQSLVDKSLVRHTKERFWMLETIREYALERLAQSGAEADLRRRHAHYFLRFAEHVRQVHYSVSAQAFARIEPEHDNLRGALAWARDCDEDEALLRLAAALSEFWDGRGFFREARTWLALALERASSPAAARMEALRKAAGLAMDEGELGRADALLADHRRTAEQAEDPHELLRGMNSSAHLARAMGDFDGARARFLEVKDRATEFGDRQLQAFAVNNIGLLAWDGGDFRTSLRYSAEAVELFRELGSDGGVAAALGNCGWNTLALGEASVAEDWFRQALIAADRLGAEPIIASLAVGLAGVSAAKHEEDRAAQLLGAAASLDEEFEIERDKHEEQIHDRIVAAAKARLGDDAFASAWARGQTMRPKEIVQFWGEGGG